MFLPNLLPNHIHHHGTLMPVLYIKANKIFVQKCHGFFSLTKDMLAV